MSETPLTSPTIDPRACVLESIAALLERYRARTGESSVPHAPRATGETPVPQAPQLPQVPQLEFAEAALRLMRLPRRPVQVAVLGPTQTGKSTVVNLLLGRKMAEVSPLAGFTVHAHGFAVNATTSDSGWLESLFPGWQRDTRSTLSRDQLDHYSLVDRGACEGWPETVIWDTPDFDSLASHSYRRGFLEIAALADVYVLVLSKEKYADLTVWRMLQLLARLDRPFIIVLNKITDEARTAISDALLQRLRELFPPERMPTVAALTYRTDRDPAAGGFGGEDVSQLRECVRSIASKIEEFAAYGAPRERGVRTFVRSMWAGWWEPVADERAALESWGVAVRQCVHDAVEAYRRDYLEHPQRFDSFRRATAELLALLEIPVVGGVLGHVRGVVTWPARQLWAAGSRWLRTGRTTAHHAGSEELILSELVERILTTLERDAFRRADAYTPAAIVWRALAEQLDREKGGIRDELSHAGRATRASFAPEIQFAANRLYDALRERPALLHSLRAARATTDAASIVLAIKTGGLHVNDLVLAPAMLAVTSLLTEGALGTYMRSVADDLRHKQLAHVRSTFFNSAVASRLFGLGDRLEDHRLLGVGSARMDAADAALRAWEAQSDA